MFFGATKMNNNVAVVDEVAKTGGKGIAATLFVKDGDQFVRVATTVAKPDKSRRAIGTALDPGPALDALKTGKAYNGVVSVFDKPYVAGYEPIADSIGSDHWSLLRRSQKVRRPVDFKKLVRENTGKFAEFSPKTTINGGLRDFKFNHLQPEFPEHRIREVLHLKQGTRSV